MKKLLAIVMILFAFSNNSNASHLMGGEITWECIKTGSDAGKYIFTVKVYRDCQGIPIDTNMFLTAHNIPGLTSINLLYVGANDLSPACDEIDGPNPAFSCNGTNIDAAGNGNGAVEEHIYQSEAIQITGTPDANGWHFTWSSCCRNNAISNGLANAGFTLRAIMYSYTDSLGTLHPNGNNCYDSSPKFYETPRTVLESNNGYDPLAFSNGFTYSHNAFDDERDSLVYSWAQPIDAYATTYDFTNPSSSGLNISGNYPGYAALSNSNPIPGVFMNYQTGKTWYPADYVGNFVTCTKVSAYNCGQLVSEVFREIQVVLVSPTCNLGDTTGGNVGADTLCNIRPLVQPPFFFPLGSPQYQWDTIVHCGDTVAFDFIANDYDFYPNGSQQDLQFTVSGGQFMDYNVFPPALCDNPPCATFEEMSTGATPPFITAGGTGTGSFEWITSCNHIISTCGNDLRPSLYTFVIKVQDDFCPAPAIENTAQVISITVCPPCDLMKANATSTPDICSSNNGTISVSPSGGFPAYHAFYFDMAGIPVNPDSLSAGDYEVRVRDSSLCETIDTITVLAISSLLNIDTTLTLITDSLCLNSSNGSIDITPIGGVAPYSFLWNDGVTTEDRNMIGPGTYTVDITDVNLCSSTTLSFDIAIYSQPVSTISSNAVTCNGSSDGFINLTPSSGQAPYNYLWNNGSTSEDLVNIPAGLYSVVITDSHLCSVSDSINITEPFPINSTLTSGSGTLSGIANGGSMPYTLTIYDPANVFMASSVNNFGTTYTVNPLVSGIYTMITVDANGCSDTVSVAFATDFTPSLSVSISNNWCDSLTDLSIFVSQDSGEVDMSTALFQSNAGSFDIASMSVGDTIGTSDMMAGGGTINLSTFLVVSSIISPSNAVIQSIDSISGALGTFTISNQAGGGINIISNSIPDGNNYTNGNSSSVFFDNVFINPCVPLVFTSTINSELGDTYISTVNFTLSSLYEFESDKFLIYPNPTKDNITIEFSSIVSDLGIKIYDILAREILIEKESKFVNSIEIDLNNLIPGNYIVQLNIDGEVYSDKIIIQD
jgi:hypothetical protein